MATRMVCFSRRRHTINTAAAYFFVYPFRPQNNTSLLIRRLDDSNCPYRVDVMSIVNQRQHHGTKAAPASFFFFFCLYFVALLSIWHSQKETWICILMSIHIWSCIANISNNDGQCTHTHTQTANYTLFFRMYARYRFFFSISCITQKDIRRCATTRQEKNLLHSPAITLPPLSTHTSPTSSLAKNTEVVVLGSHAPWLRTELIQILIKYIFHLWCERNDGLVAAGFFLSRFFSWIT